MKRKRYSARDVGVQFYGSGKIFDQHSYWGNLRGLLFACVFMYIGWYVYDLIAWWDSLWGVTIQIDPGKQSWARFWAVILGGMGIITALACMIMIPINRRRACKSAEGQWYDSPDLTREALYEETAEPPPEPERKIRPEMPETPAQWAQESTPTHLIVPPAAPGERGGTPVERRDGRFILVVSGTEAEGRSDVKKG